MKSEKARGVVSGARRVLETQYGRDEVARTIFAMALMQILALLLRALYNLAVEILKES